MSDFTRGLSDHSCQDSEDDKLEEPVSGSRPQPAQDDAAGEATDLSDMTVGSEVEDINGNAQVPPPVSRRARQARREAGQLAQVRPLALYMPGVVMGHEHACGYLFRHQF